MLEINPLEQFQQIWQRNKQVSPLRQKSPVCISTIDESGFPDGRFVDLKHIDQRGIIFCTSYQSTKASHISCSNKVALTGWWEAVECQVRVIGTTEKLSVKQVEDYWQERNPAAKHISNFFKQSQPMLQDKSIDQVFAESFDAEKAAAFPCPEDWGGYRLLPEKMEFLFFKETRLHKRTLFTRNGQQWQKHMLQP